MLLFSLLISFITVALALAWYLISKDRGEKEPILALWWAAGFGLAGAFLALGFERLFINEASMQPGAPAGALLIGALGVGLIEEICKFAPLAAAIYGRRFFNEHTDGVIYFALAGVGFGLPENILYTLQFGTEAGKLRLILTPVFHAAATGVIGYFLIKRKLAGKSPWGVAVPLLLVAGLHAIYNFGLLAGTEIFLVISLSITLGLNGALFMAYLRATQRDQERGLSAVGHNAFCRACGQPNPHHYLYCAHCGKRA